jgi:hypothetical protein
LVLGKGNIRRKLIVATVTHGINTQLGSHSILEMVIIISKGNWPRKAGERTEFGRDFGLRTQVGTKFPDRGFVRV